MQPLLKSSQRRSRAVVGLVCLVFMSKFFWRRKLPLKFAKGAKVARWPLRRCEPSRLCGVGSGSGHASRIPLPPFLCHGRSAPFAPFRGYPAVFYLADSSAPLLWGCCFLRFPAAFAHG